MKNIDINSFDLSLIYTDPNQFNDDVQLLKQKRNQLVLLKETYTNSIQDLYNFFNLLESYERLLAKVHVFAYLNCDVDPSNQEYQTMLATVLNQFQESNLQLTFVNTDLCSQSETIEKYLEDPMLSDYKYKIQSIIDYKAHILSENEEQLINQFDSMSSLSYKAFDAMRLEHPPVMIQGKPHTLNSATLIDFLRNPNPIIRKIAFEQYFGEYKKFENVFAATLSQQMDQDEVYATIRHFDNSLEASVFEDEVPSSLFHKVLEHANKTYRPLLHKYFDFKKQYLGMKDFYNYDINIPLVNCSNSTYTVDQAYELIIESLRPLGDDYVDMIKKSRTERWVDFYPKPGKRSGAYSGGSYDTKPYILMNYIDDYNSMSTLAHELGHSMHSYLSNKHQRPANASYQLFVAEVASIVNEVLLLRYMLAHAPTNEKTSLLYEHLESLVGTIYRQPMYAEFEYKLHALAKNKEALSSSTISDLYTEISKDYYGKNIQLHELTGISCYHVPHFYYNYYVYKYTVGMTVALALVKRILEKKDNTVEKYLNFLSSGGSKSPVELLEIAGVNPLDDSIYHDAFNYFDETLNEFISLMK